MLSSDDLSGSLVMANKNVAVISGHTCAQKNTRCNHVLEQLHPVRNWGTNFVVAPFSFQQSSDTIYILAAKPTEVTVVSGETKKKENLVAGQVFNVEIFKTAVRIEANDGVQVIFLSSGGRGRRSEYGPFMMNIIDTDSYCSAYAVFGQQGTENIVILVAENAALKEITFDGKPFNNQNWNPIEGTEFNWLEHSFGSSMTTHKVENPTSRFGLQSLGISLPFSYGSPGACVKDPGPPPPSCRDTHCPARLVCVMENKKPKCVRPQVDLCWASGDPHFYTFDRKYYDFMGTCTYKFAVVCGDVDPDLPKFAVNIKNDNRGSVHVSYIGQVSLEIGEYNILIKKGEYGFVRVNNCLRKLPITLTNGTLRIFQSGNAAMIQLGNDMMTSYDWNHYLWIELTRRYAGKMCGMCGNYNQDPEDDHNMPSGIKAENVVGFGASWAVQDNTFCWHDCHGPCLSCPPNAAQRYAADSFCGLISKTNGPFAACHSVLPPKMYMENCVFDVCTNNGYKLLSCQAVSSYAEACQRSGVNIGQWRDTAGCPLPCPENSSYKSCGRACPANCEDLEGKANCTEPCVETCECNAGFVLSAGKCIPKASCGCSYNGFSYAPNEEFWDDTVCRQRCKCNPGTNKVECKNSPCRDGEECAVRNGILDCYPMSYGVCVSSSGYITFDKNKVDFQGTCVYQLAGLSDQSRGLPNFQVRVRNQKRGNVNISSTTAVYITIYDMEIQISRKYPNKVLVNNQLLNLPYKSPDGKFSFYRSPCTGVFNFQSGMTVQYNYEGLARLTLPGTYANAVSGLCGNFNKNPNDDLIPKGGNAITDPVTFGKSWKVEEVFRCQNDGSPICDDLASEEKRQRDGSTECGVLVSQQGPFRKCHSIVDPQMFFARCVNEYCVLQKSQRTFCSIMTSYMMACQDAGITVDPWRSKDLCPFSCPAQSSYAVCTDPCPVTCNGLSIPDACSGNCTEGCVCNDGFILSGGECIPISDCGCSYNGAYYSIEDTIYVGDTCSQTCTCTLGGIMKCVSSSCSPNEECRVENGVLGCHPLGSATCTTSGYSNYQSFDGKSYRFQGQCSYVLAQTCNDGASGSSKKLDEFKVIIKHEKHGSGSGVVGSLTVEVGGHSLTLRRNQQGVVQINGTNSRIPATLQNGKIRVECYGQGTLIKTSFGLQFKYDLVSSITVTVPGNYKNTICGLCGNYNGKVDDDGVTSGDVIEFGNKWKAPDDPGKECGDCGSQAKPCPICTDQKLQVFSQNTYCGLIKDPSGPFARCHSVVNPASFYDYCVSDLCQTNGEDSSVICDNAYVYADACRRAGVKDLTWRTDAFCPMTCNPNTHYSFCADMCSTTCASFSDMYECSDMCDEGCECNQGFVFDGADCVPLDQCGCYDNGRYYQANEIVLNDDCSQECSCNPLSGVTCRNKTCAQDEKCQILDGVRACVNTDPCKSKNCRMKESCQLQKGLPVCVPDYTGLCWAWGDPHYHTLDGKYVVAQGTCSYIMSEYNGNDTGLVPFLVITKNNNRGSEDISFVKKMEISLYNYKVTVEVGQFPQVDVNGELANLPITLADGKLNVYLSGFDAIVEAENGIKASFDWDGYFTLTLPSSYFNEVSGLCGNFNQDPNDDQRTRKGELVTSITDWLREWKVYDRDPFCFDECPSRCPTCEEAKKAEYQSEKKCGIIFKENGPFRDCVKKVSPNQFFDACLFDVCMNGGAQAILCQSLEIFASACLKEGLKLYDWRTSTSCPKLCADPNSHYNACGNACPACCSDRNAPSKCTQPCVETCECNTGMLLSGGKCVPISDCGCQYNGRYYDANQSWYDEKCTQFCRCDPILGMVVCQKTNCKKSETCMVSDGKRGCYPTQYSTCSVSGDIHYTTFDKRQFDFAGTCTYQLVKVTSVDPSLPTFTISVHNNRRGNTAFAYIEDVSLEAYNKTITINHQFPQRIKVDGQFTNLPYYYNTSKIIVYASGCEVVLTTEFNTKITFDRFGNLHVTVPGTYAGAISGLCGNNNGNPSDDFNIGNNITAKNEKEFGDHWKVGEVNSCTSECTNCPKCNESEKDIYRSDQYCGRLTKPGPFSQCHASIDPTPFFENCLMDACAYKGHQSAVCNNIASYVSQCQKNGSMIKEWRTPSFCGLICPSNSHYSLVGNSCPTTCFGLIAPPSCVRSYAEGCYCSKGLIQSGGDCVPISDCGCTFENTYYKLGQEFYSDNGCQRKCTCGANGITTCTTSPCGANEECKIVNGVLGCSPREFGQCAALPGPYYISLDGLNYKLQGTCTYTLLRVKRGPVNFEVSVILDNQALTKSVNMKIGDDVIDLQNKKTWAALINKEQYNLPCQTQRKEYSINKEGNNIIVLTKYGFKVLYDGKQVVYVWVPSTFAGATQGLCGNFNKNPDDDFQLPNGTVVTDAAVFGESWASGSNCGGCSGDQCPKCDEVNEAQTSKCGLIADPKGPFKGCHALVPPENYVRSCTSKICSGSGGQDSLCANLQAYAALCQEKGGKIEAWRSNANCPMGCSANSHYELCTRTCDVSCNGLLATSTCTSNCFEGCECDLGYMFDGENCVTMNNCGCNYYGRYFKSNESLFSEDCSQECICISGFGVHCQKKSCAEDEICQIRDGIRSCGKKDPCANKTCHEKESCKSEEDQAVCVPDYIGECWAWGDPHHRTFDGRNFDAQGTCAYVMSQYNGKEAGLEPYRIVMKNDNRGTEAGSYVKKVELSMYGFNISIAVGDFNKIRVNGVLTNLPVSLAGGKLKAYQSGFTGIVEAQNGLKLTFDWNWDCTVSLPSSYHNMVSGLCGNFNQDPNDDQKGPNGAEMSSITDFLKQWKVPDNDIFCLEECKGQCPTCDENKKRQYGGNNDCGMITNKDGPFRDCIQKLLPTPFFEACLFDVCVNGGAKVILCNAMEAYAKACLKEGAKVYDWRTASGCAMVCKIENSHYNACGNACPATCSDRNAPARCTNTACVETCECKEGMVLSGDKCVPPSDCGCENNGYYYEAGQSWYDETCATLCRCDKGKAVCQPSKCKSSETCKVVNGIQGCHPIGYSECIAEGNLHYRSFDKKRFSYKGTCIYQLVNVTSTDSSLIPFSITVQNGQRGNKAVSFTKDVTMKIYSKTIALSRDHPKKIKVDGVITNLPYYDKSTKITAYLSGTHIKLQASFGLSLSYDGHDYLRVKVPNTYTGAVGGLCGNNNGNPSDDFVKRDRVTAKTPKEFGDHWKVGELAGCRDECTDCPTCNDDQKKIYRSDKYCGLLIKADGPFGQCHASIDPTSFFENCVHDACEYKGHQSVISSSLSSYVYECQSNGSAIKQWRTPNFCAMNCPANSHYELLGNGCPATCFNHIAPPSCEPSYTEGCYCNDGYIRSGEDCVPIPECGCVFQNIYYKMGQEFYTDNRCQKKCTCGKNGVINCASSSCGANEECKLVDGTLGCQPKEFGQCIAWGNPHFITPDGNYYDFHGTCKYILIKIKSGTVDFEVTVDQKPYGNVAVTKSVTVKTGPYVIFMGREGTWSALINKERYNLPCQSPKRDFWISKEGNNIIVYTKDQITVMFDHQFFVSVLIPSTFFGLTQGLCGNSNKNPNDDFRLPNGTVVTNVAEFGESWVVDRDGPNCRGCSGDQCPKCDEAGKALANSPSKCGMITDPKGPFKDCHKLVNPENYVKSCVTDVCNARGGQEAFSASLQFYTALCQAKGAKVGEWRNLTSFPPSCPDNSNHSTCMNSCDFTCYAVLATSSCSKSCYEGCECNSGYVLDGGQCVAIDHCGCIHEGRYVKANETLVNDNCTQECTCDPYNGMICIKKTCAIDEKCQLLDGVRSCVSTNPCNFTKCHEKETCKIEDNKAVCIPDYIGNCSAFGETHITSFDGKEFSSQGTCSYIFAKYNGSDPTLVPFEVRIKSNNRGSQATAFVKMITVEIYNTEISWQVGEFPDIRVNGVKKNLPVNLLDGKIIITRSGFNAVLEAANGLEAQFDWNWHATLNVPSSYHKELFGLCGNFNQDPKDDQKAPNGTVISSILDWITTLTVYDRDPFCFHSCPTQCPECEEKKMQQYGEDNNCGMIFKADGPFRECIKKVEPRYFFDSCLRDVCLSDGAKSVLGPSLETYARTCQNQGLKVYDWRTPSGCPMVCEDKNSHYNACANACPASCFNRNAPATCTRPCIEACECNEGMVLSGDKCVPVSSCGCQYNGLYFKPNQTWYDDKCSSFCQCDSILGFVDCQPIGCKENEDCMVINGKRGCYPTGYSTCMSNGDRHYLTFDKRRYRHMGTCSYQMVKVTSKNTSLTPFTINVLNDHRGNQAVSFAKEVTMEIYNKSISLGKDYPQQIKVDGVLFNLPYYFQSNKITAFISGRETILQLDIDVKVTYSERDIVRVILPSTYKGAVSGLCGNNNGNSSDDFLIGDGIIAKTADEFGEHWKVGEVKGCTNSCPDCPKCSEKDQEPYKADKYCGLLTKSDGPFSQCHKAIDPSPYFDNCLLDACAYKGHQSVVSASLEVYVADCQKNGSVIKQWRTPSFCEMSCPDNSHYELPGNGCPATCFGLMAPPTCEPSYTEGCYCNNGFVLSGTDCVPVSDCGCVFENTYYKKGQEFYTNNLCKKKCSCGLNGITSCQDTSCREDEECKEVNGLLGCHPKEFGQCMAWGDSHFITLDGKYYNHHGTCSYTLTKVKKDKVNFEVTMTNKAYGNDAAKLVTVKIGDDVIYLEREKSWSILLNRERCNLPFRSQSRNFWINREGNNIIINTHFGFTVFLDSQYFILLIIPSSYAGLPEGLCGNYNKNPDDDFRLNNKSIVTDAAVFAQSWTVARDGSSCGGCSGNQCPKCDEARSTQANSTTQCGMIGDPQGPFKECHGLVNPKQYVESCVLDICSSRGGQAALCANMQAYTALCQEAGANVGNWRNMSKCAHSCQANSHYEPCTRTCDFTCNGLLGPNTCSKKCFEGCQCKPGYMFDGVNCVTVDKCGCFYNGRYLKTNEVLVSEDCSRHCTCQSGTVSCVHRTCATNETCQLRDGVRSCQPKNSECTLGANLRFTTFDGVSGKFPEIGSFILASSCNASNDEKFMVVVDIHRCIWNKRAASLQVFTSQGLLSVNQDQQIWLNGWELKAPTNLAGGAINIQTSASEVTIELRDRITVVYGHTQLVKLIAKERIARNICGPCGNFNGEASDDLYLRNGDSSVGIEFTVHSWAAKHLSMWKVEVWSMEINNTGQITPNCKMGRLYELV
ncbi:IgGFc-binding protein-like [Gastrophryne carolinensis]